MVYFFVIWIKYITTIILTIIAVQKDIGAFQVPVEDVHHMELPEASHHGNEDLPHSGLIHVGLTLLALPYFLIQIPIIGVLHNYAQILVLVRECLLVSHNVRVNYRREDPNFIQGILPFTG